MNTAPSIDAVIASSRPAAARPRVSVLLPCHDAATTLPEAIDSLRAQTFEDFEVVAVDDRSADTTGELLAEWAASDQRVTVLTRHQTEMMRSGIVPALNLAAEAASAPLLARMDADDVARPDRLATQLAFLDEHPDLAGCGAHIELFSAGQIRSGYRRYEDWINGIESPEDVASNGLIECPVAHPTLLVRASVLRAVGGYRDMGWAEDHDLVLRVLAAGARLANVPGEALLRWRIREDRLSLTAPEYTPEAFRRCRAHFLREAFLPVGRGIVVWGAGSVGKPLARELIRRGTSIAAFVDLDPRKIGQQIHGVPVWAPDGFERRLASGNPLYVLATVGSPGAREEISRALEGYGLEEFRDFRFCA